MPPPDPAQGNKGSFVKMDNAIFINTGLQPGADEESTENRFNGFPTAGKPLKRLASFALLPTRLKPGVNETGKPSPVFCGIH